MYEFACAIGRRLNLFVSKLSFKRVALEAWKQEFALADAEALEPRFMLSALFPAYVDGTFTLGDANSDAPYGLANTFLLESNPTATKTIYLDYDGHHSVDNRWNHDIMFPAFDRDGDTSSFSDLELEEIQKQFQNVAEDFLPFDVNVTTMDPGVEALRKTDSNDDEYGIRAVNTQATDGFGNGIGGVAYLNSFDDDTDNPVFTFNKGINNGGMTNSHEVGHSVGLGHDGLAGQTYHPGVGSRPTSWGPIMGAPFGKNLTQWNPGDYQDATNTQDDLQVITKPANGFGFRPDDYGDDISSAFALSGSNVFEWGVIEQTGDKDFFRINAGDGNLLIDVQPFGERPNLDIEATLYDSSGSVIASSNPADDLDANFDLNVGAGTYYLSIDGVGKPGVYSQYGSLGFYTVNATIPTQADEPAGEAGTVLGVTHVWKSVSFSQSYVNPILVLSPASFNGADPSTVRVRNVTSTGFEVQIDEWIYLNGLHVPEDLSYIVVEAGSHTLADGTRIEAGSNNQVSHDWSSISFDSAFNSAPVVLSQTVSLNGSDSVVTRMQNVSNNGFSVRVQEEEGANGLHVKEVVSWIAIDSGLGTTGGGSMFEAGVTGDVVTDNFFGQPFTQSFGSAPLFFAGMQTFDGSDPTGMRIVSVSAASASFFLEEERSSDVETTHVTENVGYLAIESGSFGSIPAPPSGPAGGWVITNVTKPHTIPEGEFWSLDGDQHGHENELSSWSSADLTAFDRSFVTANPSIIAEDGAHPVVMQIVESHLDESVNTTSVVSRSESRSQIEMVFDLEFSEGRAEEVSISTLGEHGLIRISRGIG